MTFAISPMNARYRPLAPIGRGAMAEVILAERETGPGETGLAALKRLWPALADDPELVSMFLREGRLGERMNHANVVRTFEVVEEADGAAIAMEYLEGQPLARVLNRLPDLGALGLAERLGVLVDVLAGLDHVHEMRGPQGGPQGIVHRDVNPQNVFVTYDGGVKLMDFGVAKNATDPYQTRPGGLRGKLAYLAPEQALGERVDRRADLFSVGVMLWELLTGRRMWQAMTEPAIMQRLEAGAVPSLPWDPSLPAALAEVCACALAREPEGRFPTARGFAAELQQALPQVGAYQRRYLGRVVALAFAPERAARRTLIEEHRRLMQTGEIARQAWSERVAPATRPASLPTPAVVAATAPPPFRRARWMAAGFGIASLVAGAELSVRTPLSGAANVSRAAVATQARAVVAAPEVPATVVPWVTVPISLSDEAVADSAEPVAVAAPSDPRRHHAKPRPSRTTDAARSSAGQPPSVVARNAAVDDDPLAPTIDLTGTRPVMPAPISAPVRPPLVAAPTARRAAVKALDVADPFVP